MLLVSVYLVEGIKSDYSPNSLTKSKNKKKRFGKVDPHMNKKEKVLYACLEINMDKQGF